MQKQQQTGEQQAAAVVASTGRCAAGCSSRCWRGASWDDARPGSELHEELLLRDFLWGALGEADVVRALEREVWRMTTDREVVRAIHRPPADAAPRAHVRGELIRGIVERGERENWEAGARQALPGSRAQAVPETLLRRSDRRLSGRLFGGLG